MKLRIFGVVGGLVVAVFAIMAVQMVSHQIYPMPEGLDLKDKAGLSAHMATLPDTAYYIVIGGYALGAFLGGWVATRVAKEKFVPALIIGILLSLAALMNGISMPQPMWMSIASVLVMIPLAWLGAKLVKLA